LAPGRDMKARVVGVVTLFAWVCTSSADIVFAAEPAVTDGSTAAASALTASGWSVTTASDVRYYSWRSTRGLPSTVPSSGGSGAEVYVPYAVQLVGKPSDELKIEMLGRSGWVWARQSTPGLTGELYTNTDTQISATATYLGINGIQPFASVNFNVPTGRSALFGSAANARMDPDLVEIATFGEGFNVGPTGGVSVTLGQNWIVTASAGYTNRGDYQRESALASVGIPVQLPTTVQPGDVFTGLASIGYQAGPLTAKITGTISTETETKADGIPFVRPGRRYLVSGSWAYNWADIGVTTLTASWAHSNRNKVAFVGPPSLLTEPLNTNSDMFKVGLEHLVPIGQFWVGPTGSFLLRERNGYDPETIQFVPAKQRWTAGAVAKYAATPKVTLNARVEHVWTHENDRPDEAYSVLAGSTITTPISAVPVISSEGWQIAAGFNVTF
jgi:hypothetical protein